MDFKTLTITVRDVLQVWVGGSVQSAALDGERGGVRAKVDGEGAQAVLRVSLVTDPGGGWSRSYGGSV